MSQNPSSKTQNQELGRSVSARPARPCVCITWPARTMSTMADMLSARANSACFNILVSCRSEPSPRGTAIRTPGWSTSATECFEEPPEPNTYNRSAYMGVKSRPPQASQDRPPKKSRPTHCSEYPAVLRPVRVFDWFEVGTDFRRSTREV